jgi:Nitrile hydratase beta subunit
MPFRQIVEVEPVFEVALSDKRFIDPRRGPHDMGGLPAAAIQPTEHDYALWEKRVDAMLTLLSDKGLMTVDELRRNIESLGHEAYDRMSYYERWMHAVAQTMIQRGVISVDELGRKIAEVQGRPDVSL